MGCGDPVHRRSCAAGRILSSPRQKACKKCERREGNGEVWYMMYTYTAAAADILYIMLYGFVRVHQMWIEYLHRSLREVILGLRLRSGMESLYRFVFTRDVYRVKVCLIIAVISGYIRGSSS